MAEYRAYVTGPNGYLERPRMFVCDADEKAIAWAKQLMSHGSVELWSGGRLVKLLPCSDDKQAVSMKFIRAA